MTATAKSGPPKDKPPAPAPPPPPGWRRFLIPIGVLLTLFLLFFPFGGMSSKSVGYATLAGQVHAGHVDTLTLKADGAITGKYDKDFQKGASFTSHYPTGVNGPDNAFLADVKNTSLVPHFTATGASNTFLGGLLSFLPLLLFIGYFWWIGRQAKRGGGALGGLGGMLGVGKSTAKIIEAERPDTTFADVAGYEGVKRDVSEVVDFLKKPDKYTAAGATGPKGVLMAGPPGTGKTLLARAVAGEAEVPFLSVTGSSFVELFVGVGASRVRDLFAEARKRAPSIIFIDEIDAIGQRRSSGGGFGGNDEREQTLNQLLAEMDGFDPSTGVVVIAATNRPETLDPALLRPGRFDRQVAVPLPNQAEREAILKVHARGKNIGADVNLNATARATPGFSGADLANLVNEAAIVAVRAGRSEVSAADLSQARDRVLLGQRLGSNFLLESEKKSVAVHESGHALVAAFSPAADPVDKVTILPSGMALGVTEQLPEAERHLYSMDQLTTTLAVQLGGRAAELVVFGQGSTGASNDLQKATELATRMVREFGLSPELGPVGYGSDGPQYLGVGPAERSYSEETQRVVDNEVARLLREAEARAIDLLTRHRDALDELSGELLEKETVDGATVHGIADRALGTPVAASSPFPAG
jgi:cell division protease FtsH